MQSDGARFNTLFHGLLERGVYLAPALYEAGFVSAAHSEADIDATLAPPPRCSAHSDFK
jgi:glutamate-1-semialdehyde 2,1-aminomutase